MVEMCNHKTGNDWINLGYPLEIQHAMESHHLHGKTHYNMLNFQKGGYIFFKSYVITILNGRITKSNTDSLHQETGSDRKLLDIWKVDEIARYGRRKL